MHARAGRARRRRGRIACLRAGAAHVLVLGGADAPHHRLAGQLGRRSREGHRRPGQVPIAAQAPFGAPGNLRRGQGRPDRPVLRARKLHAGAPRAADNAGAAGQRGHLSGELDLFAHALEAFPQSGRVQRRQAAGRVHPRPGADVHQEADQDPGGLQGPEDPLRRRRLGAGGDRARRLALLQARGRVLRAAQVGGGRRHFLPGGVDHLVQA